MHAEEHGRQLKKWYLLPSSAENIAGGWRKTAGLKKNWRTDHTEGQPALMHSRMQGVREQKLRRHSCLHISKQAMTLSQEPITHPANSKLGEPWEPGCRALTTMSNDLCEVTLRWKWGSSETEIQTVNRHQGGWAGGSGHQQNKSPGFGSQGFLWL